MTKFTKTILATTAAAIAIGGAVAPATAQDRWDWGGGRDGDRDYRLVGPGVPILYPELRNSHRGRTFVLRNFDFNHDGVIDPREADAANRAFAQAAGPRRDRFDWDHRGPAVVIDERGPRDDRGHGDHGYDDRGPGNWDRGAMRGYGFRQTARGATMRLDEDVLFATDSAALRPGAVDKLRGLADYLRAQTGVRVAIDGYTDSRGSNAHNQTLSENRAASVRNAFDEMGVTRARFSVAGHGEASPVAPNTTPQGMRQNRRVEVTLLGQRADSFMRDR